MGKSVNAYVLFRDHIQNGGIGLWIPIEIAETSTTLSLAIDAALLSLNPSLGAGSGLSALRIAGPDHPILLVVDDINRSGDPRRLIRKAIAWSRPAISQDGGGLSDAVPIRLVCPLWEAHWSPIGDVPETIPWAEIHAVGSMTRDEAVSCIRAALDEDGSRLTDVDICEHAERLGDDPFLLSWFGYLYRHDPETNPVDLVEDVIGKLVEKCVEEVSGRHGACLRSTFQR